MRKIVLSFAVLLLGPAAVVCAQNPAFGIKAGASLTSLVGGGAEGADFRYRSGFHGGFLANFALARGWSVQPELLYSMKGANSTQPYLGGVVASTSTRHYLDVPVLAHVKTGRVFFAAGPQIGFLVAASSTSTANGRSITNNTAPETHRIDVGYAVDLGYQSPAGPGVGLRYNGGLSETRKISKGNVSASDGSLRNSAFQGVVKQIG